MLERGKGIDDMNPVVRKARLKEINQIQGIAKMSWNATYDGIIPRPVQDNFLKNAYSDDMIKRRIDNFLFLVGEVDNQIIGFANFSPVNETGEAELGAIYLMPDAQGNGIGTALLKEGIAQLSGVKKIFINVEKQNEVGKRFYEAKGFQVFSEFDDNFDGHILRTIRMVLKV